MATVDVARDLDLLQPLQSAALEFGACVRQVWRRRPMRGRRHEVLGRRRRRPLGQVKMLTPPGPTSSPTTISTMPHST
jgi:hypothetical protein